MEISDLQGDFVLKPEWIIQQFRRDGLYLRFQTPMISNGWARSNALAHFKAFVGYKLKLQILPLGRTGCCVNVVGLEASKMDNGKARDMSTLSCLQIAGLYVDTRVLSDDKSLVLCNGGEYSDSFSQNMVTPVNTVLAHWKANRDLGLGQYEAYTKALSQAAHELAGHVSGDRHWSTVLYKNDDISREDMVAKEHLGMVVRDMVSYEASEEEDEDDVEVIVPNLCSLMIQLPVFVPDKGYERFGVSVAEALRRHAKTSDKDDSRFVYFPEDMSTSHANFRETRGAGRNFRTSRGISQYLGYFGGEVHWTVTRDFLATLYSFIPGADITVNGDEIFIEIKEDKLKPLLDLLQNEEVPVDPTVFPSPSAGDDSNMGYAPYYS